MYAKKRFQLVIGLAVLVTLIAGNVIYRAFPVLAASTYTVNSTDDDTDANPGNDVCETVTVGECTLRAAIQEANAHVNSGGNDVINFAISGSGLHTFQPASAYASISDAVTINGYSQTGSSANTAVSPNPFNGTLTIELNGQSAGAASGLTFGAGSAGSFVRGLVINRFAQDGVRIGTDNITVQGNYIGTNSSGMTAQANNGGIQQGNNDSDGAQIGGTDPDDRNIISGNTSCGSSPNTNSDNWVYEGNYIGPNAAGTGALGNGSSSGCGGISIDNNNGTRVGGTASGSANLISGNGGGGIQPDNASNMVFQGNLIGTDYTGTASLPNGVSGIAFSLGCTDALIGGTSAAARNIISANTSAGVSITGSSSSISVLGNYIGTDITGTQPLGNSGGGIQILASNSNTIGGTTAGSRNIVSANTNIGIRIVGLTAVGGAPADSNTVQGNYIGTNASGQVQAGLANTQAGIQLGFSPTNTLIGGTTAGAGNIVAGNGSGILNVGFSSGDTNLNNSFLGNSIFSNSGGSITTLGIDLANSPDGSTYTNTGVTPNDAGDTDASTNHYMNFPVISAVTSSNGQASITYSLDINNSETGATGYRVEFFANDSADASGNGEGQTYLGADTVSGDVTNRTATVTLPSGVSGTKFITAVTTMTDSSADGFGHSSEFSAVLQASLVAASSGNDTSGSGSLADTGVAVYAVFSLAAVLLLIGLSGLRRALSRQ